MQVTKTLIALTVAAGFASAAFAQNATPAETVAPAVAEQKADHTRHEVKAKKEKKHHEAKAKKEAAKDEGKAEVANTIAPAPAK
ncbi:MAG: amine oxidase [Azonexaceae bacterium]|nr:amine oxidase [Azonexaceae bacterium]